MSWLSFVEARKTRPGAGARAVNPLRRRLWPFNRFFTIGAALILAIGIGDAVAISMQRDASIAAYETATTNLARGMSAQTAHLLTRVDKLLTDVATAAAAPAHDDQDPAQLLAERGATMEELGAFVVTDASGHVVAATRGGLTDGDDISATELFRTTRASASPVVEPGRDNFRLARRLSDPNGHFAGVAVAAVSAPALRDFYRLAMPPRRVVTLMSERGAVLAQYPRSPARIAKAAPLDRLTVPGGACVASFGPDLLSDEPVVAAVCRFNDLPFVLMTTAPAAEALASWRQERTWLGLGGVVASLVVVWLLYVFARQVRRLEFSELSLAAQKLQAVSAHRQLDIALSNIIQGVCFFDGDHRLIVANPRFSSLYDLPEDVALPGAKLSDIAAAISKYAGLRDLDAQRLLASLEQVARAQTPHATVLELANGRTIAVQSQPLADGGWVATHEDITERRRAEDKISYLAKHDVLTGLVNRAVLAEQLGKVVDETQRGSRFAVLFMDLDHFKAVNDTLGHDVGDALLKQVAARLERTVPRHSTIARFGGDEFVILLTGVAGAKEVADLALELIRVVSAPYKVNRHEVVIGASIGVELSGDQPISADTLLKNADIALYTAKSLGRGVYRFFEPEMESPTRDRHRLQTELRNALAENRFELVYQPIFETRSGEVCAFEALLRWNQPGRELVAPGEFIAEAEQSGLIIPIGEFVIQQACWQAAQWPGDIRVAINLSPVQFGSPDLVSVIEAALAASGLAPRRLELEITETVLLKENGRNLAILRRLRELGVGLVMDDFGVGYSSLTYLRQFTFDKVKIDRSFVSDLAEKPESIHFVRAIVGLCRGLNIRTTVEGVETEAQFEMLRAEGCTEMQGFLLGRPESAERVAETLDNQGVRRLLALARGGAQPDPRNEFLGRRPYDVLDAVGQAGAAGLAEIEDSAGAGRSASLGRSLHKPAA